MFSVKHSRGQQCLMLFGRTTGSPNKKHADKTTTAHLEPKQRGRLGRGRRKELGRRHARARAQPKLVALPRVEGAEQVAAKRHADAAAARERNGGDAALDGVGDFGDQRGWHAGAHAVAAL
jgi:hypothetical protein